MAEGSAKPEKPSKPILESAIGSAVIIVAVQQLATKLIAETSQWILAGALGLLLFLVVVVPILYRSRLARRSSGIREILLKREVDKNPWKVAALIVGVLIGVELLVSGALGFLLGYLVPEAVGEQIINSEALGLISIYTLGAVVFASAWAGRYATHRIAGHELWWALGAILAYRIVTLPLNLLVITVEAIPWLGTTGTLLVAGWMGHRLGRRTEPYFTMTYLFKRLSPQDQGHLVDLAASVALPPVDEPPKGDDGNSKA